MKCLVYLFCMDLNAEIQKKSGIQSMCLDGNTSNKVSKPAESTIPCEMTGRKIKEKKGEP